MTKEEMRFEIEVLQRNKSILSTEAVVVNTSVILGVIFVDRFVQNTIVREYLIIAGILFGVFYSLWVSHGNIKKHRKIKQLHKKLR